MRPVKSNSPYNPHHQAASIAQLDEVICAAIHLLPDAHSSLVAVSANKKSTRLDWEKQLWRSVEILLLSSRDRTYQLPLIGIPPREDKSRHILVNLGKIMGLDLSASEVLFLNLEPLTGAMVKYDNRRMIAVVIIKVRGALSVSNGDPACNPMLKSLNHIAAMPLGRQSSSVVDAVTNWLGQECTSSEQLFKLFHQPKSFTPVKSSEILDSERRIQTFMGGSYELIPASQSDQSLHYRLHYAQHSLYDSRAAVTSAVEVTASRSNNHSRTLSSSPALVTRDSQVESDYATPPRLGGLPTISLSDFIGRLEQYDVHQSAQTYGGHSRIDAVSAAAVKSSHHPKFTSTEHLNSLHPAPKAKLSKSAESLLPSKKLTEWLGTTPVYTTYSRSQQKQLESADYPRDPSFRGNSVINLTIDAQCNTVTTNPMRNSNFTFTWKVDIVVKNPMSHRKCHLDQRHKESIATFAQNWSDDFPLHSAVVQNDVITVASLMSQGHLVGQRDRIGWSPLHYAAWYGHQKVLSTLLKECSVNLVTHPHERTPLHLAAIRGHTNLVALLLSHLDVNIEVCDSFGKTAINYCENPLDERFRRCKDMIGGCLDRQSGKLIVHLMDDSSVHTVLTQGDNTTVKHVHHQLMGMMDLPENCIKVFALNICSKHLQFELKENDKVVEQLEIWKRVTVPNLLDRVDLNKEQPRLMWKRNSKLTVEEEKQVKHLPTLSLLFREALFNYMKSCYPCTTQDVIFFGSLLLHIFNPKPFASASFSTNSLTLEPSPLNSAFESDIKQVKQLLSTDKFLHSVIPKSFLKVKGNNWPYLLLKRFKEHGLAYVKKSKEELEYRFLSLCWNLTIYGSALFSASVTMKGYKNPVGVIVGVNDFGVHVVHEIKKHLIQSFCYKDISWLLDHSVSSLRIQRKESDKPLALLRSKQAPLISQLMYCMAPLSQNS